MLGVGPLLDHGQEEGGDQVVHLARERARHRADPEADSVQDEVQPAVQPVGGERGAPRRAGDPDVALDARAQRDQGCAEPFQSRALLDPIGAGEQSQLRLVERQGAALQPPAAQQLADEPAAAVADQVQPGPLGQPRQNLLGVLDRAAAQRMVVERQDAVPVGGLQPPPLGALRRQRPERAQGVGEGAVQEQQPRLRALGQPLLDRRQRLAAPSVEPGLGDLMRVDACRDRGRRPAGEVDPDQPQALDRPIAHAAACRRRPPGWRRAGWCRARRRLGPAGRPSSSGACSAGR